MSEQTYETENKDVNEVTKPSKPLRLHKEVNNDQLEPASVNKRVIAFFLDGVLTIPFLVGAEILVTQMTQDATQMSILSNLLVTFIYWVIPHYMFGKTLGKKLLGLEVVSVDGKERTLGKIVLRETFGKWISLAPLGLGFIWFRFNKQRKAWHDSMCGTMVVQVHK